MHVDFSSNYFELFELPPSFQVDDAKLLDRYRELQRFLHPDRYAAASDTERRWSLQAASFVNEAHQTLTRPLARAAYLLSLHGISIDEETDTQMAPEFLMQQMELREALADAPDSADPQAALDNVGRELREGMRDRVAAFASAADKADWAEARSVVRQWQFLEKLKREVRTLEERLDG